MVGLRGAWLWLALGDVVLLVGAFIGAYTVRMGWPPPLHNFMPFLRTVPILAVSLPLVFYSFGLYMHKRQRFAVMVRSLCLADGVLFVIALASAFWLRDFAFPRSVVMGAFLAHAILALGWRAGAAALRKARPRRVVIAAPPPEAIQIVTKFMREPQGWWEIAQVASSDGLHNESLGRIGAVDVLVLGPSVVGLERTRLLRLALEARATVYVLPDLHDILMVGSFGNQVDDLPVFEVQPMALTNGQRKAKRLFDLIVTLPMLILAAPVMGVVWICIKVLSPGPALFKQTRVGTDCREFTVLKFRTMVVDAEEKTGPVLAKANDPRVTPLGDFLRATRLDELPQLWNVIRGDMSLVGPRPERPYFVAQFAQELPDYPLRHTVPPGVTGLAQVMGKYGTTAEDKLRFDLFYVRHYSIWLDLRILLLTVQTVLNKLGASDIGAGERAAALKAEELVLNRSTRG